MKKWCFLITILLVFSMLSIFVSAETSTIKQGTPVIDGALDDAYASSLMLEIGTGENAYGDTGCYAWEGATAKVYFLYDDKYVYFIPSVVIAANDMVSFAEKECKVNMQRVLRQLARGRFIKSTKHKSGEVRYRLEKRIGKTRYRYITFHKNIFLIWIAKEMLGWV